MSSVPEVFVSSTFGPFSGFVGLHFESGARSRKGRQRRRRPQLDSLTRPKTDQTPYSFPQKSKERSRVSTQTCQEVDRCFVTGKSEKEIGTCSLRTSSPVDNTINSRGHTKTVLSDTNSHPEWPKDGGWVFSNTWRSRVTTLWINERHKVRRGVTFVWVPEDGLNGWSLLEGRKDRSK